MNTRPQSSPSVTSSRASVADGAYFSLLNYPGVSASGAFQGQNFAGGGLISPFSSPKPAGAPAKAGRGCGAASPLTTPSAGTGAPQTGNLFNTLPATFTGLSPCRCHTKQFCAPTLGQGFYSMVGKTAGGAAGRLEKPDQFQRNEVM